MSVTTYGQLSSEKIVNENMIVRDMVKEISNVGINERQRLFLIYLLALELENVELMKKLTSLVKCDSSESVLLIGKDNDDGSIDS
jgi:hypothetical protein